MAKLLIVFVLMFAIAGAVGVYNDESGEYYHNAEVASLMGCFAPFFIFSIVFAVLMFAGIFQGEPEIQPDPYNGMNEWDVEHHKRRGTLDDAMVIHTAARLNQQGSGRERGPTAPVKYVAGADYSTWRHAQWIKENHPTKISNPKDVPISDAARQQQIASGRKSAHYNSDTGKWELD